VHLLLNIVRASSLSLSSPRLRFIFTYGMLIYKQLGADAQNQFAKTWGVGYALNNASEWQDVAITACKAALLIVILDALRLTKNASWFEEHGACARARGFTSSRLAGASIMTEHR
jgi:hypothetical protein